MNVIKDTISFIARINGDFQPIIEDVPLLPVYASVGYVIFIFVGPLIMRKRDPFDLRWALAPWNLFLSVLSLIMAVPILFLVGRTIILGDGMFQLVCDRSLMHGLPFLMTELFAWSKFLELIDTAFLVFRKKPIPFLHWYHHITVLCFTYLSMYTTNMSGWIFSGVNAFVHTIMYYYYYLRAAYPDKQVPWAKHITQLQISQMVFGIAICTYYATIYMDEESFSRCQPRAGTEYLAPFWLLFALVMYGSYLALFLQFYIQRFLRQKPKTQ